MKLCRINKWIIFFSFPGAMPRTYTPDLDGWTKAQSGTCSSLGMDKSSKERHEVNSQDNELDVTFPRTSRQQEPRQAPRTWRVNYVKILFFSILKIVLHVSEDEGQYNAMWGWILHSKSQARSNVQWSIWVIFPIFSYFDIKDCLTCL